MGQATRIDSAGAIRLQSPGTLSVHPLDQSGRVPLLMQLLRPKGALALSIATLMSVAFTVSAYETAPQYLITIAQGVSRAEAQTLMAGNRHVQSTRNTRSGSKISKLRVTSGKTARLESGHHLYAVEGIYTADAISRNLMIPFGTGIQMEEKPLTHGFSVTATQHGRQVEISIEPFLMREGHDAPENREIQEFKTELLVVPGEWTLVGGGGDLPDPSAKVYGTRSSTTESLTLLKVDTVSPTVNQ